MDDEFEPQQPHSRRLRRVAISLGCIVLGLVCGLVVFGLTAFRRPPQPMTAADIEAAVARWQATRPSSYQMQLQVSGRQSGTMYVEVKEHEPVSVRRGDTPVAKHTWEYWTVAGLFKIIRTDLEGLDQPERGFGTTDVSQVVQQAEFDEELGYPRRYRRAVLTTGDAIEWEVTEFRVE